MTEHDERNSEQNLSRDYVNSSVEQGPERNNNVSNNEKPDQSNNNKMPEYNFWAERVPDVPYSNNKQGTNNWEYGGNNTGSNPGAFYPGSAYQGNAYQNPYQNSPYQNSPYQNNPYQNMLYQNNTYQNISNQNNTPNSNHSEKKKSGGKVAKLIAKAVCFGLIAAISFFGFQKIYSLIDPDAAAINKVGSLGKTYQVGYTEQGSVKKEDSSLISNITKNTLPAIVSINSTSTESTQWFGQTYDQPVESSGSGIIVGKNEKELLIATNNHVVEGTDKIKVTFIDGTVADAVIKGTDATADLAVVTVDITKLSEKTLNAITTAKLGNSDNVKVGGMVIAIGNALGYGQSVTVGYISAKDRTVEVSDGYDSKKMVLLQTDAAINPGNSGGALINLNGEVIGINTVKYASDEVEGMGYAIPITRANPIITDLMNREILSESEKGYLGISGSDVTEDESKNFNVPIGVLVGEVSKGSAAEKAGLMANDIITKIDKLDITSITQLKDYVNSRRIGTEVEVTYMRNTNGKYEKTQVKVALGKNPSNTD